jgi:hypothetical protein
MVFQSNLELSVEINIPSCRPLLLGNSRLTILANRIRATHFFFHLLCYSLRQSFHCMLSFWRRQVHTGHVLILPMCSMHENIKLEKIRRICLNRRSVSSVCSHDIESL